jgi:allantoinase
MDLVVRSRRVVLPDGEAPATIRVRDGRIAAIEAYQNGAPADDLGELALLPGLVDTHVHVNEPGRTDWEGFATATRAAAAGGVTTILDMPLNSLPPTTSAAALAAKRAAATGQCHVDVGFWGGAVPGNAADLPALHDAGVFGFKAFLVDSGVPEFPPLDRAGLSAALAAVAGRVSAPEGIGAEGTAPFVVHAEDPGEVRAAPASRRYADFLASRPRAAENRAVTTVLDAARSHAARVHILHLSSADALGPLAEAKAAGVRVSAETCPHYLALAADQVPDGATQFKCCPPIRERDNQDALWDGLAAGIVDCVVSDHSPCPPALKRPETGDFAAAWGGIASLQVGLPVVWTEARRRGHSLADVVRWMAQGPAALAGLRRKGRIAVGYHADLVAFDPEAESIVDPGRLHHRHPVTPYAGRAVRGAVRATWLRGVRVDGSAPAGRLLARGDA